MGTEIDELASQVLIYFQLLGEEREGGCGGELCHVAWCAWGHFYIKCGGGLGAARV